MGEFNMENEFGNKEFLPVHDFEYLFDKKVKKSYQFQPISNISKILFYEHINLQIANSFAIDIERKTMQANADGLHWSGLVKFDTSLSEQDLNFLLELFDKIEIMNWAEAYDNASPGLKAAGSGYIWDLAIQYNDGTAWYYSGESSPGNPYLPEGYDILVKGLNELAERKNAGY